MNRTVGRLPFEASTIALVF